MASILEGKGNDMPGARGKIRQDQARCWSTFARSPQIRVNQDRTSCDRHPPPLHLHGKMTPRPADNAARLKPREEQRNSSFTRRTRVPTVSRDNDASNVLPTCARRVGTVSEPPEGMPPTLLSPAGRRPQVIVVRVACACACRATQIPATEDSQDGTLAMADYGRKAALLY
jgi:hypothetical protein